MGRRYSGESDIYALYPSTSSSLASPSKVPIYEDETQQLISKKSSEPSNEAGVYKRQIIMEKGSPHSFIRLPKKNKKLSPRKSSNLPPDPVLSIKIPKTLLSELEDDVVTAYVLHTKQSKVAVRKMNLYEAFGVTSMLQIGAVTEKPVFVVEIFRSGVLKRFQVPYKYCLKTKWILYGRHIYVYMGHSFVEFKSSPNLMSLFMCVFPMFKAYQDYYRCLDCNFTCLQIGDETTDPCPLPRILTEEMNYPYDRQISKYNFG